MTVANKKGQRRKQQGQPASGAARQKLDARPDGALREPAPDGQAPAAVPPEEARAHEAQEHIAQAHVNEEITQQALPAVDDTSAEQAAPAPQPEDAQREPVREEEAALPLDEAQQPQEATASAPEGEPVPIPQPQEKRAPAQPAAAAPKEKGKKKKQRRRHYFSFYVFLFTLFVVVGSVVSILVMFNSSGNALFAAVPDVELPSFDKMTREEVERDEAYKNFHINWQEEYSGEYDKGIIFDQSPKAPKQVKENATITLRVSKGIQKVTVPDIKGWKKNSAREKMRSLGLKILFQTEVNEDVEVGTVLRTEPAAGRELKSGDTVTVFTSRLPPETEAWVPSCVGLSQIKASQMLANNALNARFVTEDSTLAKGTVISQSPAAGSATTYGATVTLTISSGVPDAGQAIVDGSGGIIYVDPQEAAGSTTGHHHSWQDLGNGHRVCMVCLETQ